MVFQTCNSKNKFNFNFQIDLDLNSNNNKKSSTNNQDFFLKRNELLKTSTPPKSEKSGKLSQVVLSNIAKKPIFETENQKTGTTLEQTEDSEEDIFSEEEWETKGDNLITDFMNQVNIIEQLNKQRPSGLPHVHSSPQNPCEPISAKDKKPNTDLNDFEFDSFDKNFYQDMMNMNQQIFYEERHRNLRFRSPNRVNRVRQKKKKWNLKMISLCKSLHFFNIKSLKIPCKFCNQMFTPNGLGGHVSRKHKNLSIQYIHREKTKKFRKLNKERNKKYNQMSIKK